MLKELKLSNFRLFSDEVTIRFRPITVLIGRNNYGKSSVVKFLLMLKQSLDKDSSMFLNPEGNEVNLGSFSSLKNISKNRTVNIENLLFELTVGEKKSTGDVVSSYLLKKEDTIPSNMVELVYTTSAEVSYNKKDKNNVKKHEIKAFYNKTNHSLTANKVNQEQSNINLLDFSKELEYEDNTEEKKAIKEIIRTLRSNINNLRHLLPVRGDEKSVIIVKEPPLIHVGKKGKYTLPHLRKIQIENKEKYDFIADYINKVTGINKIDFTKSNTPECFATNKLTEADTLIGSFGFGVSQCIPIFVQGVLTPQGSSLIVEQPEAQLHPTAQLELGSFFANLWKKYQVGSVIETHSENVLLRLRRLIASGDLTPEDVSVAFFDFDTNKGKPIVKNLDIDTDGFITGDLPLEFFGANLEEVLKMGAET